MKYEHILWLVGLALVIIHRLFFGPFLFPISGIIAWSIGTIILISGLALFSLATNFRHKHKGQLATKGIYGYVRHPEYSSIIIMMFGISLLLQSLLALIFSILTILGLNQDAKKEEKRLIETYGDAYKNYMKSVPRRFIPGIF